MKFKFKRDCSVKNEDFKNWSFNAQSETLNTIVSEIFSQYFEGVFSEGGAEADAWINPVKKWSDSNIPISIEIRFDGYTPYAVAEVSVRDVILSAAHDYIDLNLDAAAVKSMSSQLRALADEIDSIADSS